MPVIALAGNSLTNIDAAKLNPVLLAANEDLVRFLINAASDVIEEACNRKFYYEEIKSEEHQGSGHLYLQLNRYPIVSVIEVLIDDSEVTDYTILSKPGLLRRSESWPLSCGIFQDLTNDYDPASADYNIEVTYIGGYVTPNQADEDKELTRNLPYALEQACIEQVLFMLNNSPGIKSESIGNYKYQVSDAVEKGKIPPSVMALIAPYRQVSVA